jgi:hypothetical protein
VHILNIGHAIGDTGASHTLTQIVQAVERLGIVIAQVNVHESDTETTTVLRTPRVDSLTVHTLATVLGQDCIAVWHPLRTGQPGELIGPNAAAWGEFNPEFFILPEGGRLSTFLPLAVEA